MKKQPKSLRRCVHLRDLVDGRQQLEREGIRHLIEVNWATSSVLYLVNFIMSVYNAIVNCCNDSTQCINEHQLLYMLHVTNIHTLRQQQELANNRN